MIHKKENDIGLILKVAECSGNECFSWLRTDSSGEDGTVYKRQEFLEKRNVA
jgi:hypothetical protein